MTGTTAVRCERCGREIDDCDFCDDPDCAHPICSRCLGVAFRERPADPLAYGG